MVTSQVLVSTAECRMVLRIVKNHDSFRSCLGLGDDLKAMFPGSAIYSANSRTFTRYYVSEFQMHGDHMTLSENLLKFIGDLPEEKLTRTVMDGPNVKWKVLEVIQIKREEDEYPPLEDIGSCGLHVVSGALHSAVLAADWPVEKVLEGMCKPMKDVPARRVEYIRGSATGLYPEKFCVIRWVENEPFADRAIKI